MVMVYIITGFLILNLFKLQVVNGENYRQKTDSRLTKEVEVEPIRGEVLDRTGTKIATSELNYNIYIYKVKLSNQELNKMGKTIMDILNKNKEKIENPLPIQFNPYEFIGNENNIQKWKTKNHIPEKSGALESLNLLAEKYEIEDKDEVDRYNIIVFREILNNENGKTAYGVKIAEYIKKETAIELEERNHELKGLNIVTVSKRNYGKGSLASHIVGYTSRISEKEYNEKKEEGYSNVDIIGKTGIEKTFEKLLKGEKGKKQIDIGLNGEVLEEYVTKEAKGGANIILTIDEKLQKITEEALKKTITKMRTGGFGKKYNPEGGSAVVMNVKTGEVLAMASYPDFEPNDFVGGISSQKWLEYNNNKLKPLLNRSIQGLYAPASTYKMMMSVAALNENVTTTKEKIKDTGIYPRGQYPRCWIYGVTGGGHGWLNVEGALKNSCNYYFYEMGVRLGIDKIEEYEKYFGLGDKTGIEIAGESKGVRSSRQQTDKEKREFNDKDLLSTSIGQSYNSYTPIQLAKYISMIANGGKQVYPTIIKNIKLANGTSMSKEEIRNVLEKETGEKTEIKEEKEFNKEHMKSILEGMRSVTGERGGTAYSVFKDFNIEVGGKTGSAEVSETRTDGLFVGFAPFDNPEIAIVTIIENGEVGFHTSEVVLEIMKEYFGVNIKDVKENMTYTEQSEHLI